MIKETKEKALKKLNFYEKTVSYFFWSFVASFVFLGLLFVIPEGNYLLSISMVGLIVGILIVVVTQAIISIGMFYHQIKRGEWPWLILTIVVSFVGFTTWIVPLIFYYVVMKKEFKKGKGVYK